MKPIQDRRGLRRFLFVIPAQAGIQCFPVFQCGRCTALLWLDSRFRGNDEERE